MNLKNYSESKQERIWIWKRTVKERKKERKKKSALKSRRLVENKQEYYKVQNGWNEQNASKLIKSNKKMKKIKSKQNQSKIDF